MPASGESAFAPPIGARSGQSLADANLLKLELRYGVALQVPLVAPLAVWIMERVDGCSAAVTSKRLGPLDLGDPAAVPPSGSATGTTPDPSGAWRCAYYRGRDEQGRPVMRWPIRVAATVRMQSPARTAGESVPGSATSIAGPSLGLGPMDAATAWRPASIAQVGGLSQASSQDGSSNRGSGFLALGAPRAAFGLGACDQP